MIQSRTRTGQSRASKTEEGTVQYTCGMDSTANPTLPHSHTPRHLRTPLTACPAPATYYTSASLRRTVQYSTLVADSTLITLRPCPKCKATDSCLHTTFFKRLAKLKAPLARLVFLHFSTVGTTVYIYKMVRDNRRWLLCCVVLVPRGCPVGKPHIAPYYCILTHASLLLVNGTPFPLLQPWLHYHTLYTVRN